MHNWCYHGSVDEAFATLGEGGTTVDRPSNIGAPVPTSETTRVVEFNDLEALERALAHGDVAAILVEPALTNIGIVLPDDGYNEGVRELATRYGALLINDETHTICAGPGGYTRAHDLHPDLLVIGKSIGGGIPCGTFGFTAEIADRIARSVELEDIDVGGIGGTLAGNGLSMAAMKATLEQVMTPAAFEHMVPLADAWADGVQAGIDAVGADWHVTRLGARAEYNFSAMPSHDGQQAHDVRRLRAAAVPPPLRPQPRHPADALPQHGADVPRHDRGRRRGPHRDVPRVRPGALCLTCPGVQRRVDSLAATVTSAGDTMSESQTTHSHDATEGSAVPAPRRRRTKLGIVGAGAVGATLAYASLMRGAAQTVALYDINGAKVRAEALDLAHGIQFMPMAKVEGSDDVAVLADSDVIVFTAGAKQKPGQSRLDLAETTIGIVKTILPQLVDVAPDAVHIMVTNPVDVVTYAALQVSGLPPNQLFGSGTVLDSSRLRFLLAEHTGVAAQSIHAYVVGEHGDSELPLWSSATIGSVPLLQWLGEDGRIALDEAARERIATDVVQSAYRIIEGKGATNYAIGLAGTRVLEAVVNDEGRILPVSSLLDDYYGISDVCLSVPAIVHAGGVGARVEVPMTDAELAGLRASADAVRATARRFGF